MSEWRGRLALLAAALWWCGLGLLGLMVVPLLFRHLPSPALAGGMAAHLFSVQNLLGIACGLLLLVLGRREDQVLPVQPVWVLAGMVLALLLEFGVAPRIVQRENLPLWHAVGTALYALQWFCAGRVLWDCSGVCSRAQP